MRKNKTEGLKEISISKEKELQVKILCAIDDYCTEQGITYFLLYGSLLGAIRHNGFIPWDDDIDIGMPREDYNKFFEGFNKHSKEIGVPYKAINIDLDNGYYLPMGKVIDNKTILVEEVKVNYQLGVFIDVFPIDSLPASRKKCERILCNIGIIRKMLAYKHAFWSRGYSLLKNIYHMVMKVVLLPFSSNRLCKWINTIAINREERKAERVGSLVLGIYGEREIWCGKDFDNIILHEFEGRLFPIPEGYDNLLHRLYGDYMKEPPLEEQVNHHKNSAFWREA